MIEEEKGGEKMGDCGDGGREGQRERKGGWGHWPGATARSLRNTTRDNRPTARAGPPSNTTPARVIAWLTEADRCEDGEDKVKAAELRTQLERSERARG